MANENLGKALQGLGAWWSGRGPEYELARQKELEREQEMRDRAAVKDTAKMYGLLEMGDLPGLTTLIGDRYNWNAENGVDNTHTQRLYEMAQGGDISGLTSEIVSAYDVLARQNLLAPRQTAASFKPKIVDGYLVQPDGKGGATASPIAGIPEGPSFDADQEKQLRKELGEITKTYVGINDSFGRILASIDKPTGAGDMALIFNYMKMLDPGSTVREGEFATASATGTWGDRIEGARQQVISGKRLSAAQRADFANRAARLYEEATTLYDQRVEGFKSVTAQYPSARPEAIYRDRAMYRNWRDKYSLPVAPEGGDDSEPASSKLTPSELKELSELRAWAAGQDGGSDGR